MTLNEIAYNIRNIVAGGIGSDDSDTSLRQIKFMIHYHRANLLINYTDSGRKASSVCFQMDALISGGTNGVDLKPFVGFNNDRAIRSIVKKSTSSNNSPFYTLPLVNHHDREFLGESRFIKSANSHTATIHGSKLYVWQGSSLHSGLSIEVNAIFSNPTTVSSYVDDDTTPYPIPEELTSVLVESILKVEFNVISSVSSSGPNNQADEIQRTNQSK